MTESRGAREQLIDAMARAVFDSEVVGPLDKLEDEGPVRDIVTVALDALLAVREAVPCEVCGGMGKVDHINGPLPGERKPYTCPSCSGREGQPLMLEVLGATQVGWAVLKEGVTSWRRIEEGTTGGGSMFWRDCQPVYTFPLSPGATK